MRLCPPYELGAIAADVADRTGIKPPNPFSRGSIPAARWQHGFDEELKRLVDEEADSDWESRLGVGR